MSVNNATHKDFGLCGDSDFETLQSRSQNEMECAIRAFENGSIPSRGTGHNLAERT